MRHASSWLGFSLQNLRSSWLKREFINALNEAKHKPTVCVVRGSAGEVGAGDPCEGQIRGPQRPWLHAHPLNAGPLLIQHWFPSVSRGPGRLCVQICHLSEVVPRGLQDRDICWDLLKEVGFSKSGSFLAYLMGNRQWPLWP